MLYKYPKKCIIETVKGDNMYKKDALLMGFVRDSGGYNSGPNYDVALVCLSGGRLKKVEIEKVIIDTRPEEGE